MAVVIAVVRVGASRLGQSIATPDALATPFILFRTLLKDIGRKGRSLRLDVYVSRTRRC